MLHEGADGGAVVDLPSLIGFFETGIPFNAHLGMKVDKLEGGVCLLRVPFRPEFVGDPFRPALHGGVISAMVDAAGGLAVFSTLEQMGGVSTVDLRVDYLRRGLLEDIVCEARVIRAGNRVAVTSMQVLQGENKDYLTAEGRAVYNILRPEKGEK
jgi:uncharacterized protein (TIGR00369 family)